MYGMKVRINFMSCIKFSIKNIILLFVFYVKKMIKNFFFFREINMGKV